MARLLCTCSPEQTQHTFVRELGEYNEIYEVKCAACGLVRQVPRKEFLFAENIKDWVPSNARVYWTKFPYVEPHTGEVVHSKEHRAEVIKRMGFHVAEHGVNERYDDQACADQRAKRQAQEARRRLLEDRRKWAGVAPRRAR